jgi:hypothetical protein
MSADTSAEGTEMLAARMVGAAHDRLGLQFRTGVASFPNHGTSYAELVAVASASAAANGANDRVRDGNGQVHDGNGNGNGHPGNGHGHRGADAASSCPPAQAAP